MRARKRVRFARTKACFLIPIAKPYLGEEELAAATAVLRSGQLVMGPLVRDFEAAFAAHQGALSGVATNNGTSALIAALLAHGIGPGDEVIVPAFTFFATASAVLSVGARPVFADIEASQFGLDPASVDSVITKRTRAIIAVHLFGHIAKMDELSELCSCRSLLLIEDAAQAHGASYDGKRAGHWGTACFSFHPSKNITTTEGGMVLTSDTDLAKRLRLVRNQGMSAPQEHTVIGYNLRMTEPCAAIGLVQLSRLDAWNELRRQNAAYYEAELSGAVQTPQTASRAVHCYQQYTIRVPAGQRDALLSALGEAGIEARAYYRTPLYRQAALAELGYGGLRLPETERAAAEVLSLPVHPHLSATDRGEVARQVALQLGKLQGR